MIMVPKKLTRQVVELRSLLHAAKLADMKAKDARATAKCEIAGLKTGTYLNSVEQKQARRYHAANAMVKKLIKYVDFRGYYQMYGLDLSMWEEYAKNSKLRAKARSNAPSEGDIGIQISNAINRRSIGNWHKIRVRNEGAENFLRIISTYSQGITNGVNTAKEGPFVVRNLNYDEGLASQTAQHYIKGGRYYVTEH